MYSAHNKAGKKYYEIEKSPIVLQILVKMSYLVLS